MGQKYDDWKFTAGFDNVDDTGNFEKRSVEINEDHANENKHRGYLLNAFNGKGISHHHLHLDTLKAYKRVGKLYSGKRKERLLYFFMGDCEHEEAEGWVS